MFVGVSICYGKCCRGATAQCPCGSIQTRHDSLLFGEILSHLLSLVVLTAGRHTRHQTHSRFLFVLAAGLPHENCLFTSCFPNPNYTTGLSYCHSTSPAQTAQCRVLSCTALNVFLNSTEQVEAGGHLFAEGISRPLWNPKFLSYVLRSPEPPER
jgi:hypothetical protein